ncbi:glutamate mutase L [Nocardioides sp. CCNWLW239]|uniref:glutamate mutase L n=1 Tax=Nocardioides sp. CCNWLW239 TaxID=3128902 RepID=UPI00301A2CDE
MTPEPSTTQTAVCVDFGSTWTKALHVELSSGEVLGSASAPTSLDEVMEAYDACLAALTEKDSRAADAQILACSSAGGGLRIAVVGNEELVTAEAGRRVALSSGGKVVAVIATAGREAESDLGATLSFTTPDLVLLTGGTDGGNRDAIVSAARELAAAGWRGPVVVAGNRDANPEIDEILADVPHVTCDNVVPKIGVLAPESARAAVREMFLEHVIGGKNLSSRADFRRIVQGATPDVVLQGVETLAEVLGEDVVVVDVGGATTDVHSVVRPDPEAEHVREEVVAITPVTRTVEGDLGMRWSAPTTLDAADHGDPSLAESDLSGEVEHRRKHPGWLPRTEQDRDIDELLARIAISTALQRHAGRSRVVLSPQGKVIERTGTDLRRVGVVIGSGGVLRHGRPGIEERVMRWSSRGGWQLPELTGARPSEGAPARSAEGPLRAVDSDYVLAAVGLLARSHPATARRLATHLTPSR